MKLFVAKLNRDVQDEHLVEAFSAFGEVAYARVITDRDTGQSKCFGFYSVQMRDEAAGRAAIDEMNGAELMGFRMVVKEAEERPRAQEVSTGRRGSGPESTSAVPVLLGVRMARNSAANPDRPGRRKRHSVISAKSPVRKRATRPRANATFMPMARSLQK